MKRVAELCARLDRAFAAAEASLVVALFAGLLAAVLAQVLAQNLEHAEELSRPLWQAGSAGCVLGVLLGLPARSRPWGGALLGSGLLLALVAGALQLGHATDHLCRASVLWLGALGATLATRRQEHITIEALEKMVPARLHARIAMLASGLACALCIVLFRVAHSWWSVARAEGGVFVELDALAFELPEWWIKLALPLAFALMAWRFFLGTLGPALGLELLQPRASVTEEAA